MRAEHDAACRECTGFSHIIHQMSVQHCNFRALPMCRYATHGAWCCGRAFDTQILAVLHSKSRYYQKNDEELYVPKPISSHVLMCRAAGSVVGELLSRNRGSLGGFILLFILQVSRREATPKCSVCDCAPPALPLPQQLTLRPLLVAKPQSEAKHCEPDAPVDAGVSTMRRTVAGAVRQGPGGRCC